MQQKSLIASAQRASTCSTQMNPDLVPVNVRIPRATAGKVKDDAQRFRRTVQSLHATIIEQFFAQWGIRERERIYAKADVKRKGRPVSREPLSPNARRGRPSRPLRPASAPPAGR